MLSQNRQSGASSDSIDEQEHLNPYEEFKRKCSEMDSKDDKEKPPTKIQTNDIGNCSQINLKSVKILSDIEKMTNGTNFKGHSQNLTPSKKCETNVELSPKKDIFDAEPVKANLVSPHLIQKYESYAFNSSKLTPRPSQSALTESLKVNKDESL